MMHGTMKTKFEILVVVVVFILLLFMGLLLLLLLLLVVAVTTLTLIAFVLQPAGPLHFPLSMLISVTQAEFCKNTFESKPVLTVCTT